MVWYDAKWKRDGERAYVHLFILWLCAFHEMPKTIVPERLQQLLLDQLGDPPPSRHDGRNYELAMQRSPKLFQEPHIIKSWDCKDGCIAGAGYIFICSASDVSPQIRLGLLCRPLALFFTSGSYQNLVRDRESRRESLPKGSSSTYYC